MGPMSVVGRWNDAGLLREYLAARFGRGLYHGMGWDEYKRARNIAIRIAHLLGASGDYDSDDATFQAVQDVITQAIKDWEVGQPTDTGARLAGCRGCGDRFLVTADQIEQMQAETLEAYGEPVSRADASSLIEFCPECAG